MLPDWTGQTVVCIASGPSLTDGDIDYVRDKARVIVVNNNYFRAPWADMLYATDPEWWDGYKPQFDGLRVTTSKPAAAAHGCLCIPGAHHDGLSTDPNRLHYNKNSGAAAINVAYHCGSRRVLLLGYDCELGPFGQKHWFGDHPPGKMSRTPPFAGFIKCFGMIAAQAPSLGLEIVNCSRRSALWQFRRSLITEEL